MVSSRLGKADSRLSLPGEPIPGLWALPQRHARPRRIGLRNATISETTNTIALLSTHSTQDEMRPPFMLVLQGST